MTEFIKLEGENHLVELVPERGWILNMKVIPKHCIKCKEELKTPYLFCREDENGRCKDCERRIHGRTCTNLRDSIHEHFNIIQANPSLMAKAKLFMFGIL